MIFRNFPAFGSRTTWLASITLFISQNFAYGQVNGPCIPPGLAIAAVPEPSPLVIAVALLGFGAYFRRR